MKVIARNPHDQFPEAFKSLWLNGPDGGLESCNCLVSRVPPGHKGPRLHTHPVDQFYFVFEGETTVQIGTTILKVRAPAMVHFPANTPHCNWNETDAYEMHFELMVPRPPEGRLIEYWEDEAPFIPDVEKRVVTLTDDGYKMGRLFASQHIAWRDNGSEFARVYAARVAPGTGGPALHFHDFDQLYYVFGGELTVQVGHRKMVAGPGDLVMLPAGLVHTNFNEGSEDEYHLAILIPEPEAGQQFDYKVNIEYSAEKPFINEPERTS